MTVTRAHARGQNPAYRPSLAFLPVRALRSSNVTVLRFLAALGIGRTTNCRAYRRRRTV